MFVMRKIPGVAACTKDECAYNVSNACRAIASTIGDGKHPMCDTFFDSMMRGGVV